MKKLGLLSVTVMLVALVVGTTSAIDLSKDFKLTGSVDAPYVFDGKEITTFQNGALSNSEFILAPLVSLKTEYTLGENVTAVVNLENLQTGGFGTAGLTEFGGGTNLAPNFRQAYIRAKEFFSPKLTMCYGIQDVKYSLRKGEGSFFMHVAGATTPSLWRPMDVQAATYAALFRSYTEFSGFKFTYGAPDFKDDNYSLDVLYGVTKETTVTAGQARDEDQLVGLNFAYKLAGGDGKNDNVIKAGLNQISNSRQLSALPRINNNLNIMTINVGADYFGAVQNLELYGEVYSQSGNFTTDNTVGNTTRGQNVTAKGQAYRFGGQYNVPNNSLNPYVGLAYWYKSGGNDSRTYNGPTATAQYTQEKAFVSYADPQSTLILEDHLWGLGLDSNYTAIKIDGGITTNLNVGGGKKDLDVKLLIGMFTMNNAPYTTDPATLVTAQAKTGLGNEYDLKGTLHYAENVSFTLGLGMLQSGNFFGSIRHLDNNNQPVKYDSMTLVSFGANVKF